MAAHSSGHQTYLRDASRPRSGSPEPALLVLDERDHDSRRTCEPIQRVRLYPLLSFEKATKGVEIDAGLAGDIPKWAVARMNRLSQMPRKRVFGGSCLKPRVLQFKRREFPINREAFAPNSQ